MSEGLLVSADALLASLGEFEPRFYDPATCSKIVTVLARVKNACDVATVRAGARAIECGAHREEGHSRGADWLAQKTGTSAGEAQRNLDTTQRLGDLPFTSEAVTSGEISMQQADEIAETAEQCPGSETEMLAAAQHESLRKLKDRGRKRRLQSIAPEDLHQQQLEARSFRHWTDEAGMVCGTFRLTPEVGVPFVNRVDVETDRQWRKGWREGRPESREQHAADAFAEVVSGGGKPHAQRADVVFVCDVATGASHIVGGGPVPLSTVREAAKTGFIKAVLHDGVKVDTIVHYGRVAMPALLRTVLELGDVPEFDGVCCVDCGAEFATEWDHRDPVANNGPTALCNYDPRCHPCHKEKTERDRRAGLLSGKSRGQPP